MTNCSLPRYVDPSRAVGILRGSLGGEAGLSYDNNQQVGCLFVWLCDTNPQDVCEFTHKLLDWLEEAFKTREVSQKSGEVVMGPSPEEKEEPMEADLEKGDREKDPGGGGETSGPSERVIPVEKNPMYSLFYGRVLIEGRNQGTEFTRTEQFGQWPLQVRLAFLLGL